MLPELAIDNSVPEKKVTPGSPFIADALYEGSREVGGVASFEMAWSSHVVTRPLFSNKPTFPSNQNKLEVLFLTPPGPD